MKLLSGSKPPGKGSETVLFCLVGLSPAVITETIWALANEGLDMIPNRVFAITTPPGREQLIKVLFEKGGWTRLRKAIESKFGQSMPDKMRFGPTSEAVQVLSSRDLTRHLDDVRTPED